MSPKKERIRAISKATNEVGMLRYNTYKASINRIKEAIDKGFYLEAITLSESLIADRLEHRLKYLTDSDKYSFKPLGDLQKGIKLKETNEPLKNIVSGDLEIWRIKRNSALHAMAKIEDGDSREWKEKMEECKKIAEKGEELRREIFGIIDKLKK